MLGQPDYYQTKVDFKTKSIIKEWEGYFLMTNIQFARKI